VSRRFSAASTARSKHLLPALLICISLGAYANTLLNGFVYDDLFQVLQNEWIKDVRALPAIFLNSAWAFNENTPPINYYRPVMHLVYMLDYSLVGLEPWFFHLTNVLIHTSNTLLVFFITARLLNTHQNDTGGREEPGGRGLLRYCPPPLVAAVFFALHPVNTEAVAWVAAIPELTYTFFCLFSLYLYITSPPLSRRFFLSLLCFFLATLSKETALSLPLLLFAYDRTVRREGYALSLQRYLPFAVVMGAYALLRLYALGGMAPQAPKHGYLTTFQYFINVFPLLTDYFTALAAPVNLTAFHVFHPVLSLFEARTIFACLLAIAFCLLLIAIWTRARLTCFALLWIVIPLLPVLYIPGVGVNTFAERYLYLPCAGFALLCASLLARFSPLLLPKSRKVMVLFLPLMLTVVALWYGTSTVQRNSVWKNEYTLWKDTAKKSPDSAVARYNLGIALFNKGLTDGAIAELREAVQIHPGYIDAHYNLGVVYQHRGMVEEAREEYLTVLRLEPRSSDASYNLGLIYAETGMLNQAEEAFQRAVAIHPGYREARLQLEKVRRMRRLQR